MALIHCPECDKEISDQVRSCPHCGYPLKKREPWKIIVPIVAAAAVCVGGVAVYNHVVVEPRNTYNRAISLYDQGKYEEAARYFGEIPSYRDVAAYMEDIETNRKYEEAVGLNEEGRYEEADALFAQLPGFKDSDTYRKQIAEELAYKEAENLFAEGSYDEARQKLEDVSDAERAQELSARILEVETACSEAEKLLDDGQYENALSALENVLDNPRAQTLQEEILAVQNACTQAEVYFDKGQYEQAREVLIPVAEYAQAARLLSTMDANEAGNAYIDQVKHYAFDAQTGAETARELLDMQNALWCNAAWQEDDWFTDLYTKDDAGRFVSPEEALGRFMSGKVCEDALSQLEENRKSVMEQYTALDSVPAGMEDLYERVQLMHNAYRDLTELADAQPQESFANISARMREVESLAQKYKEQAAQLELTIPEKVQIVTSQQEAFDFRHIRFGMTADEVKQSEQDNYGLAAEWEIGLLIGYTGLTTEDGHACDLIYSLNDDRYLESICVIAYDELPEDVSSFVGVPVTNGSAVTGTGTRIMVETDPEAGMILIFPQEFASQIVLPSGGGTEEGVEALMEEETETEDAFGESVLEGAAFPGMASEEEALSEAATEEVLGETVTEEALSEAMIGEEPGETEEIPGESVLEGAAFIETASEEALSEAATEEETLGETVTEEVLSEAATEEALSEAMTVEEPEETEEISGESVLEGAAFTETASEEALSEAATEEETLSEAVTEEEAPTSGFATLVIAAPEEEAFTEALPAEEPEETEEAGTESVLEDLAAEIVSSGIASLVIAEEDETETETEAETETEDFFEVLEEVVEAVFPEEETEEGTEGETEEETEASVQELLDQISGLLRLARLQTGLMHNAGSGTAKLFTVGDTAQEPETAALEETIGKIQALLEQTGKALDPETDQYDAETAQQLEDRLEEYQAELEDIQDTLDTIRSE